MSKHFCLQVVVDPTRNAEDPGDFYLRFFRPGDISVRLIGDRLPFPDGTVFQNVETKKLLEVSNGQIKKVTAQVCGTGAVERINNHA